MIRIKANTINSRTGLPEDVPTRVQEILQGVQTRFQQQQNGESDGLLTQRNPFLDLQAAAQDGLLPGTQAPAPQVTPPPAPRIGFPNQTFGPGDAEILEGRDREFSELSRLFETDTNAPGSTRAQESIIDVLTSDHPDAVEAAGYLLDAQLNDRERYQTLLALGNNGIPFDTAREVLESAGASEGRFNEDSRDERLARIEEAFQTIDDDFVANSGEGERVQQKAVLDRIQSDLEPFTDDDGNYDVRRINNEQGLAAYVAQDFLDRDEIYGGDIQRAILDDDLAIFTLYSNDIFGTFDGPTGEELIAEIESATGRDRTEAQEVFEEFLESDSGNAIGWRLENARRNRDQAGVDDAMRDLRTFLRPQAKILEGRVFEVIRRTQLED